MSKKNLTTNKANETLINYALLDNDNLKIEFIKSCGHHRQGDILLVPFSAAKQYIVAGSAAVYFESENDEEEL